MRHKYLFIFWRGEGFELRMNKLRVGRVRVMMTSTRCGGSENGTWVLEWVREGWQIHPN